MSYILHSFVPGSHDLNEALRFHPDEWVHCGLPPREYILNSRVGWDNAYTFQAASMDYKFYYALTMAHIGATVERPVVQILSRVGGTRGQ